jgi:hypothetical protein
MPPPYQLKVAEAGQGRKNVARTNIALRLSGAIERLGKVNPKRRVEFPAVALGISQRFFCKPIAMPEDQTIEWGEEC